LPFGTAESTQSTNRRFTSYDRSGTTGLDYAVNRQYDPRQGRFTQVDPIGMAATSLTDPQSLNLYSYVGNDPMNRIDPDGQFWGALIQFIAGLFRSLKPNVINGSFSYHNSPPISVSFTPNFQNIGVGYGGIGFALRNGGHWLPDILGNGETLEPLATEEQQGTQQSPSLGTYVRSDDATIAEVRADLVAALKALPACAKFVSAWLAEMGRLSGVRPYSTDPIRIFDRLAQLGHIYETTQPSHALGWGSGSAGAGTGVLILDFQAMANTYWNYYIPGTFHEIAHAAPRRDFTGPFGIGYSHELMDRAAYNVLRRTNPKIGSFVLHQNYGGTWMDQNCYWRRPSP